MRLWVPACVSRLDRHGVLGAMQDEALWLQSFWLFFPPVVIMLCILM